MRTTVLLFAIGLMTSGCLGSNGNNPLSEHGAPGKRGIANATTLDEYTDLGLLRGMVVDEEMRPIPNATVLLSQFRIEVLTADNGSFEFRSVPVGKQIVEAHASGHRSLSKAAEVRLDDVAEVQFVLPELPVQIAHYIVKEHKSKIHNNGAYLYPNDSRFCDGCKWITGFPVDPDFVFVEIEGKHGVSNPQGDRVSFKIDKVAAIGKASMNGSALASCLETSTVDCGKLPIRLLFDVNKMNSTAPVGEKTKGVLVNIRCEARWACIEEEYTTYVSAFYWWAPDPIPEGYTGGEGILCVNTSPNGMCLKDSGSSSQGPGPRESSELNLPPRGNAQVVHLVHVPAAPVKETSSLPGILLGVALAVAGLLVFWFRHRKIDDQLHALLDSARSAFARGDDRTARRISRQVLAKDPKNADAWFLYGAVLLKRGQEERAIEELEAAMKSLGPQMSGLAFILSLAYQRTGQPESAHQWLPIVARDEELWKGLGKETDFELIMDRAKRPARGKPGVVDPSYA